MTDKSELKVQHLMGKCRNWDSTLTCHGGQKHRELGIDTHLVIGKRSVEWESQGIRVQLPDISVGAGMTHNGQQFAAAWKKGEKATLQIIPVTHSTAYIPCIIRLPNPTSCPHSWQQKLT